MVQVTVEPLAVQPEEADTKVTPAGSVSETTMPVAGSGPLFTAVIVYVRLPPGGMGFGVAVVVTPRSTLGVQVADEEVRNGRKATFPVTVEQLVVFGPVEQPQ